LRAQGEAALADQVEAARVHAYCDCAEESCMSFYLSAEQAGPCDGEYRAVLPSALISISVCDGEIGWVEDRACGDGSETAARRQEYARLKEIVPGRPFH
jgi:hypothetical protein